MQHARSPSFLISLYIYPHWSVILEYYAQTRLGYLKLLEFSVNKFI